MLSLQAEGGTMFVHLASFASDGPVEKVASIELDSRLGCENNEHAPGFWIVDFGS